MPQHRWPYAASMCWSITMQVQHTLKASMTFLAAERKARIRRTASHDRPCEPSVGQIDDTL